MLICMHAPMCMYACMYLSSLGFFSIVVDFSKIKPCLLISNRYFCSPRFFRRTQVKDSLGRSKLSSFMLFLVFPNSMPSVGGS